MFTTRFIAKKLSTLGLISFALFLLSGTASAASPVIDVWYGTNQQFGHIGNPQPYVNILGNVSDTDGDFLRDSSSTLEYTLNGTGPFTLAIGPDGRRLAEAGDFNIDINIADLLDGDNTVVITATDDASNSSEETVTVNYTSGNTWPLPYSVDWSTVTNIGDVAQVVDGKWGLVAGGVRTTEPGYDRLIAFGEMPWDDYEVTVPITIHDIDSTGGVGILMRWNGHNDDPPFDGYQPYAGYLPLGAIGWYRNGSSKRLEFFENGDTKGAVSKTLTEETTYIFKMRVETEAGVGGLYSLKVWEQGTAEPSSWDTTAQGSLSSSEPGQTCFHVFVKLQDIVDRGIDIEQLRRTGRVI